MQIVCIPKGRLSVLIQQQGHPFWMVDELIHDGSFR